MRKYLLRFIRLNDMPERMNLTAEEIADLPIDKSFPMFRRNKVMEHLLRNCEEIKGLENRRAFAEYVLCKYCWPWPRLVNAVLRSRSPASLRNAILRHSGIEDLSIDTITYLWKLLKGGTE